MSDDIEIRRFYIRDCADRWGARVWASVSDGPNHASDERTKWTVYHRPDRGEQWPAKMVHVTTIDEAMRVARSFADAYRSEVAP